MRKIWLLLAVLMTSVISVLATSLPASAILTKCSAYKYNSANYPAFNHGFGNVLCSDHYDNAYSGLNEVRVRVRCQGGALNAWYTGPWVKQGKVSTATCPLGQIYAVEVTFELR